VPFPPLEHQGKNRKRFRKKGKDASETGHKKGNLQSTFPKGGGGGGEPKATGKEKEAKRVPSIRNKHKVNISKTGGKKCRLELLEKSCRTWKVQRKTSEKNAKVSNIEGKGRSRKVRSEE